MCRVTSWKKLWSCGNQRSSQTLVRLQSVFFGLLHCVRGNCAVVGKILCCFVYVCKLELARRYLRVYLRFWVITQTNAPCGSYFIQWKFPCYNVGSRRQRALTAAHRGRWWFSFGFQHICSHFIPSPHLQNFPCELAYQKCKLLDIVSIWNLFGTAKVSV